MATEQKGTGAGHHIQEMHFTGSGVPTGSGVEVNVTLQTRLGISADDAQQRARTCLALQCGQSFAIDTPILQVRDRLAWLVPVWLATPTLGRRAKIGELRIDAHTGEVIDDRESCQHLRHMANALLSLATAPAPSC
jgi:hypothetical protein